MSEDYLISPFVPDNEDDTQQLVLPESKCDVRELIRWSKMAQSMFRKGSCRDNGRAGKRLCYALEGSFYN